MLYHGSTGLDDLNEHVWSAHTALSTHLDKFDSIAVIGTSGLVVGAPVAVLLNKPLVVIRKKNDGSHSNRLLENDANMGERVLWLDDFVASGKTRRWVRMQVKDWGADLIGQYEYSYTGKLRWFDQLYLDRNIPPLKDDVPEIPY